MRHKFSILLLAVLLLAACSPLRRTQRNQKADSSVVDRSEIHKAVTDILRESGTFSQTIVEFYPPAISSSEGKQVPEQSGLPAGNDPALPATTQSTAPAVKRIVRTEMTAQTERATTTDSLAHNDIHTTTHSELSDKVVEKPPAATMTVKWIAIALAAIAAIVLILKFPKIKFPRIKLW